MEQQTFIATVQHYASWLRRLEKAAFFLHDRVNQQYDRYLPYGFHLRQTASYVSRYGHLVAENEADILVLYAAAYLHDTLEDTRMSYHDLIRFIEEFIQENPALPESYVREIIRQVPEIVYALTNEKGRNRNERADARYYLGIREVRFASFIKMCDRLANMAYSSLFVFTNRMFAVYKEEYPDFIQAIGESSVTPIPEAMKREAEEILGRETYTGGL